MKKILTTSSKTFGLLPLAVGILYANAAFSAPGELSDKPLFLGTDVQPNILWLVDDSGSMDWEKLITKEAQSAHSDASTGYYLDFASPGNNEEKRELCPGYNVMAYDPNKVYLPWAGEDKSNNIYTDSDVTSARKDPYLNDGDTFSDNYGNDDADYSDSDNTQNLNSHYYYLWNDSDNDGLYDSGECSTDNSNRVKVGDLSSAEEKQNYANWFTYYRKREYVAKRALSQIITDSQARMGLASLHNRNSVGTPIKDVDNISVPIDSDANDNKDALLTNLFKIDSNSGTPLRKNLKQAGDYFKVDTDPSTGLFGFTPSPNTPILAADQGGECQQNFTVLMSDGYWNGDSPSVGHQDQDTGDEFVDTSHSDSYRNTLADVAMKYYKEDLAPTYDNNVPVIAGVDENNAQHMVTYTVAFGVNGTLDAGPTSTGVDFTWPEAEEDTATSIDDMRHAAWNGRGEFLNAGNPDDLINSLQAAINDIADRDGAASAVAFNSTSLGTDTLVFQARFNSGGWYGALSAFTFNSDGLGPLQWEAGELLSNRDLSTEPRQIISFNGTQGVPFGFPADYKNPSADELASAQLQDLLTDAPYNYSTSTTAEVTINQNYGEEIIKFLRGDFSTEVDAGGTFSFRNRYDKRLGDVIHSSPDYVGIPNMAYPNLIEGTSNKYSDFIAAQTSRTPVVYVGANDGMLHGFRASDGKEIFAYIPGLLYNSASGQGLHYLADTSYSHIPYVDGSPSSADLFVDGSWKTYLVGGLRAGGKGIYVLDVTDPARLTESNASDTVVQEFTHTNMGYSFSRPQIVRLNNGRWAAVFGNGYNNTGDGKAKLFILYLDNSGGYLELDTGVGSIANSNCNDAGSDCNGLSTPTLLDTNGDGSIDRVYAGDLHGNLWAFNLSNTNSTNWTSAYLDNSSNPLPVFQSCSTSPCTTASRQPITTKPAVQSHPNRVSQTTEPNLMIYFGTGQYLATNDNLTTSIQSMYGIWDANLSDLDRTDLQNQTISVAAGSTGGRDLTSNAVSYTTGNNGELGWYIDLPDSGERIVSEAAVVGDIVFFNTMVPDSASCNGGGYGYLMFADRMEGSQPDFTVLDFNNDGTFDDDILGGIKVNAIPGAARLIDGLEVISDSSGNISDFGVQTNAAKPSSRASWTNF